MVLSVVLLTCGIHAQDLASFEKKITVKKLANGLTILIMERPEAPVFSFHTYVDAGAAQEGAGITGLAQVSGYRGETETLDKMVSRVACDHQYIREWSFWLDVKILFKTFGAVMAQTNAC